MENSNPAIQRGDRLFHLVNGFIMAVVCIITLYPLYYIVLASITDPAVISSGRFLLFPEKFYFEGYKTTFEYQPLFTGYANAILYTSFGTLINLALTIPGAYVLSRKDLVGRNVIMFLFTFTMFFSGGMIPFYLLMKSFGFIDTIWVMVLPGGVSVFNLIVVRTFFQSTISPELFEASRIDGCSDFRFFSRIVLPLSKTIIAVMVVFYAVGHWNSYFDAIIYLNSPSKMPLQVILRDLLINNTITNEMPINVMEMQERIKRADQLKYCVIILSSLPMMVLYPFVQKYFAKGVMIGSLKE
jgi:putative aldouronate transport system permease protein